MGHSGWPGWVWEGFFVGIEWEALPFTLSSAINSIKAFGLTLTFRESLFVSVKFNHLKISAISREDGLT